MSKADIERMTSQLLEQDLPTPEEGDWGRLDITGIPEGSVYVLAEVPGNTILGAYSELEDGLYAVQNSGYDGSVLTYMPLTAWDAWLASGEKPGPDSNIGDLLDIAGITDWGLSIIATGSDSSQAAHEEVRRNIFRLAALAGNE